MKSSPMKCANCGTPWKAHYIRCPRCGETQRTASRNVVDGESFQDEDVPQVPFIQRDPAEVALAYSDEASSHVIVVDLRLPWGAVFELVFKIWVAIIVLTFLLALAAIVGGLILGRSLVELIE